MLFGCEGDTEVAYLRALCQKLGIRGDFPKSTNGLDPLRLVERTMHSYDEDYDLVACVFDRDTHSTFDAAVAEVRNLAERKRKPVPIIAAVSQIAFELWILLHLERTDKPFTSAGEVIDHIRRHHIADYDKARAVEQLALIDTARAHAQWLYERYEQNGSQGSMTTLHCLIDAIEKLL